MIRANTTDFFDFLLIFLLLLVECAPRNRTLAEPLALVESNVTFVKNLEFLRNQVIVHHECEGVVSAVKCLDESAVYMQFVHGFLSSVYFSIC